jgi:very-short-patch-repair endonuclease
LPDKSEGQKRSLKSGRMKPPMLGKKHNADTKNKISQTRHDSWEEQKISHDYQNLVQKYKTGFHSRSKEDLAEMHKKAARAIYDTKKSGSKLERFLMQKLRDSGYSPQFHVKQAVIQEDLEVDIFLPEIMVALEVDGVTHDENIYGEDHLARRRLADSKKNGLLITNGFTVIRISNKVRHVTNYFLNTTWNALEKQLKQLQDENPEPSVIYLEVN